MSPHDAVARAKADPVKFLGRVYDHLDDAHHVPYADVFLNARMADYPQAIIYYAMDRIVREELAGGGIEVVR